MMQLNINYFAPWAYGRPLSKYLFHWIRYDSTVSGRKERGIWLLGFSVTVTWGDAVGSINFGVIWARRAA